MNYLMGFYRVSILSNGEILIQRKMTIEPIYLDRLGMEIFSFKGV